MAKKDEEKKKGDSKDKPKEKKSLAKKLPFLLIIIIILAGGGLLAFKMINKKQEPSSETTEATSEDQTKATPEPTPLEEKLIYEVSPAFMVNLNEFTGKKYLKILVVLEYKENKVKEDIEKRLFQIKDSFISVLSSKNSREIGNEEGKNALKDELLSKVDSIIGKGKITNVYFGEFIIQ